MSARDPQKDSSAPATPMPAAPALSDWLRANRAAILARWEKAARVSTKARGLDALRLLDHLPALIDEVAARAEVSPARRALQPEGAADAHALERLDQGYDLADVTSEYAILRRAILELFDEQEEARPRGDVVALNHAIDEAVSRAVSRYASAHQRTLQAIDRIAAIALQGGHGVALLESLLNALIKTTAAVDAVSLFLHDGDHLALRAHVGLPGDAASEAATRVGQTLVENVAATRMPAFVGNPTADDATIEANLREHGIRALYGVPLLVGDELIGVATMGSRSASQFSDEDTLLFRTMANRATALIAHAVHQERAERRADELETVLNSLPEGVYIGDATGLKRCNLAAAKMLGFERPEELLTGIEALSALIETRDATTGERIKPQDQPFLRATRGESVVRDVQVRHVRTGQVMVMRCSAAPLRRGGKIVGAVAVISDVTGQNKAIADSTEALALRDRVMGVLGHELRDPLSTIRVASALLVRRQDLPEALSRPIHRIDQAAERMANLILNLLDFTQSRFLGALPVTPADADLIQVCESVLQDLELGFPQRQIKFSASGETRGHWDGDRIAQIVSNLVVNALRHGDQARPVHVTVDGGASSVLLEVHNWGPPIPAAFLPALFEPFRRGATHDAPPAPGLGLGLYIVDQIVRAHGGEIHVSSAEEQGTKFSVRLPRIPRR